jgi:branched-chain amino acid transport system permease protein
LSFASDNAMYLIIVPMSVFLMLAARNIIRTRVGRAFISVRDNDLAAELLGINVFAYKLQAFFVSALYAGIAGALFAYQTNNLSISNFSLTQSLEFLAMLVIGGPGFPLGPLFGVAFVNLFTQNIIPVIIPPLREFLPGVLPFIDPVNISSSLSPTLFGLVLTIFLILAPRGLAYRWEIFKIAWKIRPYSH